MERYKQFVKLIGKWIGRMTPSQVMMLFGVVAGTIVGAIFVVGWLNNAGYSPLYSDLDESESGEVVKFLSDSNIPYQISDGGHTISVPSDQVYKARFSLASEGLPRHGIVGYAIFDDNNLGMTDFLQNLNFRRALEGELTRTIMQLSEVQAARVHIVIPEDRLFKQDQEDVTASVLLKIKGGKLTKHQINGVSHLVASSVEGLEPENIAIVDYDGNLLSSGQKSDVVAGLTASQLDVRKQVEEYLEHKAQSMLNDVLGSEKSVVRLTADLNFQQVERTSETFDPNSPSVRSEENTKSNNSTTDKASESSESEENNSTETVITNYELNKVNEHLVEAVGSINRLSIAVLVDGVYSPEENENGETTMVYQPRSQEELDRLSSIVKTAVGFDSNRNDQIDMVNLEFNSRNLDEDRQALDAIYQRDFYVNIAKKVGYFLLLGFIFLYVKKKAGKLMKALSQLMPTAPAQSKKNVVAQKEEVEEDEEPVKRINPEKRKPRLVDEMQETAKDEPDEIARVIKTMMSE
ncbi:MAG: flagellar basal-body MS-ring/collar protein FliF [candidate division Zixibacteria bacterium]|nr:flagellar basal-body MS-ring/collar protein FliF [candidate division Zixibacteria bacterium]